MSLRDLGVRAAQGFVFAPPLPGPLFRQLLGAPDPALAMALDSPPSAVAAPDAGVAA